ncbi:MAG: YfhO family protein [Chloroflexi bacterium]|nr:YfhO family protein [Chloroflexota bacterium]
MRPASWKHALPFVGILILSLLFFHQLAFSGKILARGDTYQYFYPYWDARNEAFRAGALPLWTPDLFMGAPLLANPQLGTYYPLNWLTAPFRAPTAIAISIVLHVALAAAGTAFLYRQVISEQWMPALVAGIVFAFGGAVSAHIEQINQLQGLAWMPILFALYHRLLVSERASRDGLLLAAVWALQIFSGHTQTVFISGVGLAVYGLGFNAFGGGRRTQVSRLLRSLLLLALCFCVALLLALPQLLPSLELMQLSNRSGGFSAQEATAFSLPPKLLGRALLPSYDGQLFGEYVATPGILGLGLALWGIASFRGDERGRRLWLALALVGLALALGRVNPLYLLAAELPGFNLFRVPARFLALFSLGMALLAGMGTQALSQPTRSRRPIVMIAGAIALLISVTHFLLPGDPALIFGGATISDRSLALWIYAWLLFIGILLNRQPQMQFTAMVFVAAELFLAGQRLPYNDLAPADVYLSERPAISELRSLQAGAIAAGRTFSASQIYFDPVDIGELRRRYDDLGMDYKAQFHALDAVKMQETLYPNLSVTWGIPSIDGFGGGITPSHAYSLYASLLLPADEGLPIDGRLGERMSVPDCWGACLPARRWLEATDTRYVITDKVYDIWHDDIAYDTALSRYWREAARLPALPDFADEIRILHRYPLGMDSPALGLEHDLLLTIIAPSALESIPLDSEGILALTAVNSQQPAMFQELQPPPFERVYSSATKIFRLPPTGQRAFLAGDAQAVPDDDAGDKAALQMLRQGVSVVVHGETALPEADLDGSESVEILEYGDTRVTLSVKAPSEALLVLADAWHPGWAATVNDEPAPVQRTNLVFRALPVPAGESRVSFQFAPPLWRPALYIGIGLWFITLLLLFLTGRPDFDDWLRRRRMEENDG